MKSEVRSDDPLPGGAEIWRGGVNTWECDEMGHMNVRFYVSRAMEGLAGLALKLGMPNAFAADGPATLKVREHHIRFLKEAHAGAPLHMVGGVVAMGDSDAELLQILIHSRTGEPCATMLSRVEHTAVRADAAFPWPTRSREAAERLTVAVPPFAAPRSVDWSPVEPEASLARANALDMRCVARGAVTPADCDVFGRMRAEGFIGRISDGVPALVGGIREAVAQAAPEQTARIGGAVLEYRLVYAAWPRSGDHLELRSGLAEIMEKTQRLVHWLLDPIAGAAWGSAEAVAVNFDLDARKIIPIPPAAREAMQSFVIAGLGL